MTTKYTKLLQNRTHGHKIDHHLPLKYPPKFAQIGIFDLKINHLANLV
jgi:hypothetical protein